MDYKLIDEELKRLHYALTIGANQDLQLAKWAMTRITAIHEGMFKPTISHVSHKVLDKGGLIDPSIKPTDAQEGTWVDSSGLIWYPAIDGTYTFEAANKKASELGLRLPTKEEFEFAEKEGLRSMFNDFIGRWFWSSSESSSVYAWSFCGFDGEIGKDNRSYEDNSVRLVSRRTNRLD